MTHRLNAFLLVLAALVGLPYYWLFVGNPARSTTPHPLTIGQLRDLAGAMPGQRPSQVTMYFVAWKRVPGNLYAAGSGMKRRQFGVLAWRLTVPGQAPIMIDTGTTRNLAEAMDGEAFVARSQAAVDREMAGAGLILATSERPQHLGGLAAFARRPEAAVALSRARLNPGQVPGTPVAGIAGWPPTLVLRPAFSGTAPRAVAPGVVVIPTGAPSPGAQMIFVRLASGREYLFAGDIAPFHNNFTELRVRSRLLDRDVPGAARKEQMRWLITLRALARSAPGLVVVPGHDYDWTVAPESRTDIVPWNE